VAGGSADIGVITDAVDHGSLELRPFAIDRLVLVVARLSQWAERRHIAFADVAGREFVGLSAGSPLQDYLGDHAARAGHALAFRIRLRTFEGICRMVARDVGLGIVPETAAKRYRRSMPIHSVRLTDSWATRHLAICARRFEDLHPHGRELVEQLTKP
jgi:DNA-binding transcriptional LysR family regulator